MGYHQSFLADLCSRIRLSDLIGRRVRLVRRGREYVGLCPFHSEKTPSFYVVEDKGFYHCFGCGAHGDAIGFVTRADNLSYAEAVEKLAGAAGRAGATALTASCASRDPWPTAAVERAGPPIWIPILPVPEDVPALLRPDGRTVELVNPKRAGERKERTIFRPAPWWPYRDAEGCLLGYVLRMEFERDGGRKKWTPQITFCAGPVGASRWCIVPFPKPRPLYGLDQLIARPQAPVVVVEGEKTCDAGRSLLPAYVVVTWCGGSKGIAHVDWSPLAGRDVFLLPDADKPGRDAMDGWFTGGERVPGIAELLVAIADRVRIVDPPRYLPDGWDLADANDWSETDAARWLVANVRPGTVATATAQRISEPAPMYTGLSPALNRRRLEGLVRKIIGASEAQLDGTLLWAARLLGDAALKGEIEPEVAEAVLVRAAARAGLAEIEARRTVANSFHTLIDRGTE